jgi:hypothetical protein
MRPVPLGNGEKWKREQSIKAREEKERRKEGETKKRSNKTEVSFDLLSTFSSSSLSPANSPQNHDLNAFRTGVDVRKIVPLLTAPRTGWRLGSRGAPSACSLLLAAAATRPTSSGFLDDDVAGVVDFFGIIRARPGATLRALSGLATPREASCDARIAVPA